MTGRVLLLGVAASLQLMACQLLVGIDDDETGLPAATDAQSNADADGHDAAPLTCDVPFLPRTPADGCVTSLLPERPTNVPAVDGEGGNRLTFVLRRMFLEPTAEGVLGFDWDGKCTGLPGEGVEDRCHSRSVTISEDDAPGGVDNALLKVLSKAIEPIPPNNISLRSNRDAEVGVRSLMVELYGYNGLPDDMEVSIAVVPATGFMHTPPAPDSTDTEGCVFNEFASPPHPRPAWNGQDTWCIARDPVDTQRLEPRMEGYVRDGMIVIPLEDQSVPFLLGLDVPVARGAMVARFVPNDTGVKVAEAAAVGVVRVDQFFDAARRLEVAAPQGVPVYVCDDPELEKVLYKTLSDGADMRSCAQAPSCDGVTLAVGFDVVEAIRGPKREPLVRQDPCEPPDAGVGGDADAEGGVGDASLDAEVDAGPVMP